MKGGSIAVYEMPVQYDMSVKKQHFYICVQTGLFDISHIGQLAKSYVLTVHFLVTCLVPVLF